MTLSPRASTTRQDSRFKRLLSELTEFEAAEPQAGFTSRLGALIDFNGSIRLSELNNELSQAGAFQPKNRSCENLHEHFLEGRAKAMQFIAQSCSRHQRPQRIALPQLTAEALQDEHSAYVPYSKFYTALQSDLSHRCHRMRETVRDRTAGVSPRLASLVALDRAMDESLSSPFRAILASIPKLLRRHFEQVFAQYQSGPGKLNAKNPLAPWTRKGGYDEIFCSNLRSLLLAELELRLQPTIGLLEALNEEVGDQP